MIWVRQRGDLASPARLRRGIAIKSHVRVRRFDSHQKYCTTRCRRAAFPAIPDKQRSSQRSHFEKSEIRAINVRFCIFRDAHHCCCFWRGISGSHTVPAPFPEQCRGPALYTPRCATRHFLLPCGFADDVCVAPSGGTAGGKRQRRDISGYAKQLPEA